MNKWLSRFARIGLLAFVGAYCAFPDVVDSRYGGVVVLAVVILMCLMVVDGVRAAQIIRSKVEENAVPHARKRKRNAG